MDRYLLFRLVPILFIFGVYIFIFIVYICIGFWTNENLDFYASMIKEQPTDIPIWLSFVIALFLPVAIIINIIAEIFKFFI